MKFRRKEVEENLVFGPEQQQEQKLVDYFESVWKEASGILKNRRLSIENDSKDSHSPLNLQR